jgi:hypothetical protein
MVINAPKLLEFKKRYNITVKHKQHIKSHTYSNCEYKNSFNKLKFNYNKQRNFSITEKTDNSRSIKVSAYNKYKFYYTKNIDNYKNTHDYNRTKELDSFNKNKYYYNSNVGDKPRFYMTKEDAIKEEIDETIENRFITIFLLHVWKTVMPFSV